MPKTLECRIEDSDGYRISGCGKWIFRSQYSESYLLADGTIHGGSCLVDYAMSLLQDKAQGDQEDIDLNDGSVANVDWYIDNFKQNQGAVRLSDISHDCPHGRISATCRECRS